MPRDTIKLLNVEDKHKNPESRQIVMKYHLGKQWLTWQMIFHQKSWRIERTTFFKSWKKKNCYLVNSISSDNTLEKWRWNKDILRWRKIREHLLPADYFWKNAKGSSSNRREMVPEGNMGHWEWRKAAEMITIWVTITQYSSINFYKLCTMVKSKNYNNVFWDFQYILDATKSAIRGILITLNACIKNVERL